MSLVECRYNPNHKMKPSKREIHEQKCPDRFKNQDKYKQCPYDPLELILVKDFEKHLKECKSRPKITKEDEEEIEKAKALNDMATEREQIQYARQKYYKDCIEEPEIPGLVKSKQQEKKSQKKLKAKFRGLNDIEAKNIGSMIDKDNDNEEDDNEHEIKDFPGDINFECEKEEEIPKNKNTKKSEKNKKEIIKDDDKRKEVKNKQNSMTSQESCFYIYDPNEEDKDIGKFSANIIVPDTIYTILGKHHKK